MPWAAAIAALNVILFAGIYAGHEATYFRDILTQYVPTRAWMFGRILAGEIPLWNDRMFGGIPFWGDPVQSVWFPGQWLYLFFARLHPVHALGCLIGVHYLIAHAGFFRLLRALHIRPWIAFVFSAVISCGGPGLSLHWGLQFLYGFSVLGWAAASLVHFRKKPSSRSVIWIVVWTVLMVTSGDVQLASLFGLLSVAVFIKSHGIRSSHSRRFVLAMLLAGLASAAVILPALEISGQSDRVDHLKGFYAYTWSWRPLRFAEWFLPGLFDPRFDGGTPIAFTHAVTGPVPFAGAATYFQRLNPGLCALLLLPMAALLTRERRQLWWLWGGAGVSLLMSLGEPGGLFPLARLMIPGWNQFRYPERFMLPAIISLVTLAAIAADAWMTRSDVPRKTVMATAGAIVSTALATAFMPGAAGLLLQSGEHAIYTNHMRSTGWWVLMITGIATGALLATKISMRLRAGLLATAIAAEIVVLSVPALKTVPLEAFDAPPLAIAPLDHAFKDELPLPRAIFAFQRPKIILPPAELARHQWETSFLNLALLTPHATLGGYGSFWPTRYLEAEKVMDPAAFQLIMGVGAAVGHAEQRFSGHWTCEQPAAESVRLCHPSSMMRRVRVPSNWETISDADILRERLHSLGSDTPQTEYLGVLIDGRAASPVSAAAPAGNASVTVRHWSPERRTFVVHRETEGPVILAENWYPGWTVTVGGHESGLIAANGFQMAAWVPAGEHSVEFVYQPASVRVGILISLAGIAGLLVMYWRTREMPG